METKATRCILRICRAVCREASCKSMTAFGGNRKQTGEVSVVNKEEERLWKVGKEQGKIQAMDRGSDNGIDPYRL